MASPDSTQAAALFAEGDRQPLPGAETSRFSRGDRCRRSCRHLSDAESVQLPSNRGLIMVAQARHRQLEMVFALPFLEANKRRVCRLCFEFRAKTSRYTQPGRPQHCPNFVHGYRAEPTLELRGIPQLMAMNECEHQSPLQHVVDMIFRSHAPADETADRFQMWRQEVVENLFGHGLPSLEPFCAFAWPIDSDIGGLKERRQPHPAARRRLPVDRQMTAVRH